MRRSATARKAEIVATVLDLSDRIGPDRVTTNKVAERIGLTQAALFRHFPSKAEMWGEVASQIADRMAQAWEDALAKETAPLARIKALVAAQLRLIASQPAIPMLLFSRELTTENAAMRGTFSTRLAAFHALLEDEVRAAQSAGDMLGDCAPRDVAHMLSSLVQGAAIRWVLGPRDAPLEAAGLRLLELQLRLLARDGKE